MLYLFHVDTGTTITFDIELALQNVSELKEAIERECGVVAEHQVLLMSGGESLEADARVCSYSAGTDTNPIYLFSKAAIESPNPPTPSIDYGSDVDLQSQIDASLAMPATYQTVVARAQLAQQCCGLARDQTRICERLVHDQHLQQQGWAAVVANLEDITQMFQSKAELFQQSYSVYLSERQQYMEVLENFSSDLGRLAKIPILPALRAKAEGFLSPKEPESSQSEKEEEGRDEVLSLLRWISAKDNQSSLEQFTEQCSRGLEQFDERVMEALKNEVNAAVDAANKQEMKEIKGLGERLFALEQLMAQTKKLVHEQGELAQGFLQNQSRANNLGDASVLPDLCTSHRRQLVVMLQNHNQLRDIRRRCTKAKEELSVNIYHRLKWIMYVENKMMEVNNKLAMYRDNLKRLRRHLDILQQIHLAPHMYMNAVAEVVRRRTFSQAFLVWASNLACQLLTVHSEEQARRREFQSKFDGHFLNTLFPGLEDTPPPFATQAPSVFDSDLPKLTVEDMELLKAQLPDVALTVSTEDLNNITQFFLSKSLSEGSTDGAKEKESTSMRVDVQPKEQERTRGAMLVDRGGFESETDTEEFEKIGQGAGDSKPGSFDSAKQMRQKQLEENLGNTREEVENLRTILKTMKAVVVEALTSVREELTVLRDRSTADKSGLLEMSERVREALSLYSREYDRRLREREQELTVDHELEMADVKKLMQSRDEEICGLKRNLLEKETDLQERDHLIATMRQKLEDEQDEMRNLQTRLHQQLQDALEQARIDKETAVTEATEKRVLIASLSTAVTQCHEKIQKLEEELNAARNDQKKMVKELETIRSRFKGTSAPTMERNPSDSSLEKIEKPDVCELASHGCSQTIGDSGDDKSVAMQDTEEKESSVCVKLDQELCYARLDQELGYASQVVEEIDREVELYRRKEMILTTKCQRYKDAIRSILSPDDSTGLLYLIESDLNRGERNEMNTAAVEHVLKNWNTFREEQEVSESKRVRLEEADDSTPMYIRLEILEQDNMRLNAELQTIRECKESAEAKVEALHADKIHLEVELVKERSRRNYTTAEPCLFAEGRDKDMNASVAVVSDPGSGRDTATSPEPSRRQTCTTCCHWSSELRKRVSGSAWEQIQQSRICVTTCNPGDTVLLLWDRRHSSYTLYQEVPKLYFLHTDCLAVMDLGFNSDGTPKHLEAIAEVVHKEYCHARKPENRYHVPIGTKFYRVHVKPTEGGALTTSQQL